MKYDIAERFSCGLRISSFLFTKFSSQFDHLYVGTENGKVLYFPLQSNQIPHGIRPVELCKGNGCHSAEVTCLMFSINRRFSTASNNGLLFSGSLDRTIKVWNSGSTNTDSLVQTLFGHSGAIYSVVDGNDGTLLSSSEDGTLRVWSPQRGRSMMLSPFFECTFSLSFGKEVWLTALTVSSVGMWVCYVADSEGNIEVLKKGAEDNLVERAVASFTGSLTTYCRWEKVHLLGISQLEVVQEEGVLVSLAFDGCCKIVDPSGGQVLFTVQNPRRCMYTGVLWVKSAAALYLTDEMGHLEAFSLFQEKFTESVCLVEVGSKQGAEVLKNHSGQTLGRIAPFSQEGFFFTAVAVGKRKTASLSDVSSRSGHKSVGVVGDVLLWNIVCDSKCSEFVGHEGSVVALAVPVFSDALKVNLTATASEAKDDFSSAEHSRQPRKEMRSSSDLQRVSREEKLFFSVGHEDCTLRCWDEYDQRESYQFKSKGSSEVTVMIALWQSNRIATGHESGLVCLWNADTGTKVSSRVLKQAVSSFVEANNSHSRLLVGADFGGSVAIWNLTLHSLNPTTLHHEAVFSGFHDLEDPGILSLAFHPPTKTLFSGGNDCSVQFWRIQSSDTALGSADAIHSESVCLMRCTDTYLLSGDEAGHLSVCTFVTNSNHNKSINTIARLLQFCCWVSTQPTRSIADILELSPSHAYVLQIGSAVAAVTGGIGARSKVWEIRTQARRVAPASHHSGSRKNRVVHSMDEMVLSASLFLSDGASATDNDSIASHVSAPTVSAFDSSTLKLFDLLHPDKYIAVSELCSVTHDKHEISCCVLSKGDYSWVKNTDGDTGVQFKKSCVVYLGTMSGVILKYTFV